MIIKKIMLENYRSHKNTCVELSKGINLILGVNGSGKSSILEAIGNVLFGINDRTGKQKGKSFIRYGENSAKVEIEFVANDEREYSIKNIFSLKKSGSSVLKDLYTGKEYKNKEEIDTKLSELCGIKRNYTAVYENIIIAKQNEFINIFKETPAKREEVFNKVFNTELYSGMYSGILKDIEDKYSSEKNKIELEKKIISSDMKDENLYLDEIKELEINEKNILTELEEKNLEQKKLIEKVNSYKLKEKNLETLKKQKLNKKETLKQQKEDLKLEILRTKKTKKSVILIEKNKEDYEKYMLLIGKLEKNKKELENLKIIEENNQKLIKINEKLTWEIENFSNEKEKMLQNISLKENEYLNLNNELGKLLEKEKNLKQLELNLRNGLAEIEKIDDNKLYLDKNLFSLKKSIETNEKILETKKNEKDKIDIKKIKEDIEYRENLRKKNRYN